MTFEPGTADITTTLDQPFPGGDDNTTLANIMRRLLAGSGLSLQAPEGPVRLYLPGGHYTYLTTPEEVEAVQRARADRQRGLDEWKERHVTLEYIREAEDYVVDEAFRVQAEPVVLFGRDGEVWYWLRKEHWDGRRQVTLTFT